jgi:nitrate ABC transporter ATP-binding subunit
MIRPLEITSLSKSFPTPTGPYLAVKDFSMKIAPGEFISIVGHSGCGKSTVLSILAGLQNATLGGFCIDGAEVIGPGTDRGVVFQSPCLLPWKTSLKNVELALAQVKRRASGKELRKQALRFLQLAGVEDCATQLPGELSQGTQQRVSIARALALEPRFLLLDEPFGMLDSLTRFELQDMLLDVWEKDRKTVVMVTHDVDEALYLSDRIVLMTDGPEARIGEIMTVPFARPRDRVTVLESAEYYRLHARIIDFLENHSAQFAV